MIVPQSILWYLPLLLYAETHYRFRYFLSFLKKNEPEILADAPHRLEAGSPLPLLVIAKDAHQYPCTLQQVGVAIQQKAKTVFQANLLSEPRHLREPLWWEIFQLDVKRWTGWIEIFVSITIEQHGRVKTYYSDNHRTSSHKPLRVFVANDPLPRFANLHLGDAHTHSSYTDDQVEFGPPLKASRELCRAMGLSFFCVTDHSYDLDDHVGTYLVNHPDLPKWNALQREIDELNTSSSAFAIVRGEEVTCRNGNEKNVHLLLYGNRTFFSGSGDGAERWLQTRSEHSIAEVVSGKEECVAAYAAHPREHVPFLQRLLLRRDGWSDRDLQTDEIHGIQFANGNIGSGFSGGKQAWVRALLAGKRLFAIAGNDAHGNFNRFRQIGLPFLKIKEMDNQIFGKMRTGVFVEGAITEDSILEALRYGNAIITDGPVVQAAVTNREGKRTSIGGTARENTAQLALQVVSTPEFGEITTVQILLGELQENQEKTVVSFNERMGFDVTKEVLIRPKGPCYVRVEAFTSSENLFDQQSHWCFTNPIWIYP